MIHCPLLIGHVQHDTCLSSPTVRCVCVCAHVCVHVCDLESLHNTLCSVLLCVDCMLLVACYPNATAAVCVHELCKQPCPTQPYNTLPLPLPKIYNPSPNLTLT